MSEGYNPMEYLASLEGNKEAVRELCKGDLKKYQRKDIEQGLQGLRESGELTPENLLAPLFKRYETNNKVTLTAEELIQMLEEHLQQ